MYIPIISLQGKLFGFQVHFTYLEDVAIRVFPGQSKKDFECLPLNRPEDEHDMDAVGDIRQVRSLALV